MREKLNNNPIAQVAVVAVLLLVVGVFLLKSMGGGGGEEEAVPVAEEPAGTTVAPAIGGSEETITAPASLAVPGAASGIAVPPLPGPVRRAYKADKTVVLLIVHNGGIDDRLVATSVRSLSDLGDVAVFVVPADQIARYAAVTLGVEVDRVPALIVMRPKGLSGGTPQASVTYGFQSQQAITRAVLDASYDGPSASYYPN